MNTTLPLLYSFRRCPYAIRARMALAVSGISYERIEVDLKNKPAALFAISPKGTVPVLQLPDGRVIDESLDIMLYALSVNDPEHWLPAAGELRLQMDALIERNDKTFKPLLDKFKYHTKHIELSQDEHQANGDVILSDLENRISQNNFLFEIKPSLADIALFPFIRQWAGVKADALRHFPKLETWLNHHTESSLFSKVMAV
jgi:glutathione S-transferase